MASFYVTHALVLNPCLHYVLASSSFFFFFFFFFLYAFLLLMTFPSRCTLCYTLLVQRFELQGRRFTNFHYDYYYYKKYIPRELMTIYTSGQGDTNWGINGCEGQVRPNKGHLITLTNGLD